MQGREGGRAWKEAKKVSIGNVGKEAGWGREGQGSRASGESIGNVGKKAG